MSADSMNLLNEILESLSSNRQSVCVDGNPSYQHGFFCGFALAQNVVEDIARRYGVEVNDVES
jgi:hypothetical protein